MSDNQKLLRCPANVNEMEPLAETQADFQAWLETKDLAYFQSLKRCKLFSRIFSEYNAFRGGRWNSPLYNAYKPHFIKQIKQYLSKIGYFCLMYCKPKVEVHS